MAKELKQFTKYESESKFIDLKLIEENINLVKKIAHHMSHRLPSSVMLEDLIQAGMIGLLEAASNYEEGKGASFPTFASIRVRGAMIDEMRRGDWTPRSVYKNSRMVQEAVREIENVNGRDAKNIDVAKHMGISLDAYHEILRDTAGTKVFAIEDIPGLDEYVYNSSYDGCTSPLEGVARNNLKDKIAKVISTLPERERLVLALYYDEDLNLREIGEVLSVSESRVSQILGKATIRLQSRMQSIL